MQLEKIMVMLDNTKVLLRRCVFPRQSFHNDIWKWKSLSSSFTAASAPTSTMSRISSHQEDFVVLFNRRPPERQTQQRRLSVNSHKINQTIHNSILFSKKSQKINQNRSFATTSSSNLIEDEQHPLVKFDINDTMDDTMKQYLSNYVKSSINDNSNTNSSEQEKVEMLFSSIQGKIGTLTINSPSTYNSLSMEIASQFKMVCESIAQELTEADSKCPNVQVIIVCGAGSSFSSGGNFDWLLSLHDNTIQENIDSMNVFYNNMYTIRKIPVPIIAAMNGPAMGAGAGLALLCDLRTASSQHTKLGLHFTRLGLHAGLGCSMLLQNAMGGPNAIMNEILLLGKVLSGEECFNHNIVNKLHPHDAKIPAYEMAIDLIQNTNPVAVRYMLQTLRNQQPAGQQQQQVLYNDAILQSICYNQNDWGEGLRALREKRLPNFDPYHTTTTTTAANNNKDDKTNR